MPHDMLLRLTREAAMHLSDTNSSATLRDICRRFLAQHNKELSI
jgi:hypothetical protein